MTSVCPNCRREILPGESTKGGSGHTMHWDCVASPRFAVGESVVKFGGSYQAAGVIKAVFEADDGSQRVVFRFDNPAGLLHIFSAQQLMRV